MAGRLSFAQAFQKALNEPRYEPTERLCGGTFGYVGHRFPIKGGITMREIWRRRENRPNPFFEALMARNPPKAMEPPNAP